MDNPTEPCSFNIERQRKITPWGSAPNLDSSKHKEKKHRDEKKKKSKEEEGEKRIRKSKEEGEKTPKKSKSKDSSRSAFPNSSSEASINKHEKKKLKNEEIDSTEKAEFIKKINRTNSSKRALPSLLAGLPNEAFRTVVSDSSGTSHPELKLSEFLTQDETPRDKKLLSYSKNIKTHEGKQTENPISSSTPNLSSSKQRREKAERKYKNGINEKVAVQKISDKLKTRARSLLPRSSSGSSIYKHENRPFSEKTMNADEDEFLKKIHRTNSSKSSLPSLLSGLPAEAFRPQPIMSTVLPYQNRDGDLLKALTNMIANFHIEPKPLKPSKSFCVTSASHPNLVIDEEELDRIARLKNAQLLSRTSSAVFHKKLGNLVEKNNETHSHEKIKHRRSLPSMLSFMKKSSNKSIPSFDSQKMRSNVRDDKEDDTSC